MNGPVNDMYYGYGTTPPGGPYAGSPYAAKMPFAAQGRRRLNVVAVCLSLFVPWLTFSLVFALLSFKWHYSAPNTCNIVVTLVAVVFGIAIVVAAIAAWRKRATMEHKNSLEEYKNLEGSSWGLFLYGAALAWLFLAMAVGNENFWTHMQPYYDLINLNSYMDVDPARMRGQELMDAGQMTFVNGTHIDLKKGMGFKNMDTFCVAPIAGGSVEGDPPLASYDFWAVGKNCCSGFGGDFKCGEYNNDNARSGVRVVRDEDRAFYRLAVQQVQSAYAVKAIHPLFFHWVKDPDSYIEDNKEDGYKYYLIGMLGAFGVQLVLVAVAVICLGGSL